MITLDPKFQGGKYTENLTEGIRRAALIYFPWTSSDDYLATLDEADVAHLLQKLLLVRNNIRLAAGKHAVANGAHGKWRQEHP